MAKYHRQEGIYLWALKLCNKAAELYGDQYVNNSHSIPLCRLEIAKLYFDMNEPEKALSMVSDALHFWQNCAYNRVEYFEALLLELECQTYICDKNTSVLMSQYENLLDKMKAGNLTWSNVYTRLEYKTGTFRYKKTNLTKNSSNKSECGMLDAFDSDAIQF